MVAKTDIVSYLNKPPGVMLGSLVPALKALPAKLIKAPAAQWVQTVKALASKGVKQAEIDDCQILAWLESEDLGKTRTITRGELIEQVERKQVTVKEVVLGTPVYRAYSHWGALSPEQQQKAKYAEVLFIANSERANLEDRLEEIDYELEQFNFDIERLSREPQAVLQLEKERAAVISDVPKAYDYEAPHFTESIEGKHSKNLIAHGRELVFDDTYLIDEIQSDWGQSGRRNEWRGVPRGPFVTDTKLWAGLVLRRMMQRAAHLPHIKRVAWIRGSMRNGGMQVTEDMLDEFYLKTVRGIADKLISKVGGKVELRSLKVGQTLLADVPTFEMTDPVRAELLKAQPLYSLSGLRKAPLPLDQDRRDAFFARAKHMLGSARHVRLVDRVYDVASGNQVAGRYVNRLAQVSLQAEEPEFVLDHECFHFAMDNLFREHERRVVLDEFAPGSVLNARTRDALIRLNDRAAAEQCADAGEAAAHGFALWARGKIDLEESPVKGFFQELRVVIGDALAWFRRTVLDQECVTAKEVFTSLLEGGYADRSVPGLRHRAPDVDRATT
jgi:hypothetical protein